MPKCLDPKPGAPLIQESFNQSKSCWLWGPTGRGSSSPTRTLTRHEPPSPDKVRSRASVGAASQPESGPMRRRGQPTESGWWAGCRGSHGGGGVLVPRRPRPPPPQPCRCLPGRGTLPHLAAQGGAGLRLSPGAGGKTALPLFKHERPFPPNTNSRQ